MKKYVIAIGREYCSGGKEIGKKVAERLGIAYFDKDELRERSRELGVDEGLFEMFDEQPTRSFLFSVVMDPYSIDNAVNSGKVLEAQRRVIENAADEGPCVIVGRRADKILEDTDDVEVIPVFIGADIEDRVERYLKSDASDKPRNARRFVEQRDRERASYYNFLGDGKWGKASNYAMCFSTSKMNEDKICDVICDYVKGL